MLTAAKVLDRYFLDARCMALEIAAMLDRYDLARQRSDGVPPGGDERIEKLYQALAIVADRKAPPARARRLLELFSDPV